MTKQTAAALARRLSYTHTDSNERAGIEAAMTAGGFDPTTTPPDEPRTYLERAESDRRAYAYGYLNDAEFTAMLRARDKRPAF